MKSDALDEFARALLAHVRDAAVRSCDAQLRPQARSPEAQKWRALQVSEALSAIVPDVVDHAVFELMKAIDDAGLHLKFVAASGEEIDLTEDGGSELAGSFIGTWRQRFARERFYDELEKNEIQARAVAESDE